MNIIKNVIVAQSGGPTVAINSSLLGVFRQARACGAKKVFGACFGVEGLLKNQIVDLNEVFSRCDVNLLMQTPSCFLGSCRKRVLPYDELRSRGDDSYEKISKVFKKLDISSFFYIGGNDSMETVLNLSSFFKMLGRTDISVIGVPKTIDNDLEGTDHCPGFGSAAKFVATTFLELERDCSVYNMPAVTIVEVMGRDAGWLTASSALSRLGGMRGPNLIYCCERDFSFDGFLSDVEDELKSSKNGNVLVAVSEGIKLEKPGFSQEISDLQNAYCDEFGHRKNAGIARRLEVAVFKSLGCKVRSVELSLLQRSAAHSASAADLFEAFAVGQKAVQLAKEGKSGVMVAIRRLQNEPYTVDYCCVPVENVAGRVKKMPAAMMAEGSKADVSNELVAYLKPLIAGKPDIKTKDGLPIYISLNDQKNNFSI